MSPPVPRPLPQSFRYEHTDIPAGMTLAEYRRARAARQRRGTARVLGRLKRRHEADPRPLLPTGEAS